MSDRTIDILRDLIAIDSVNPSLASGGGGEAEIANAIAATLRQGGLDVEIQEVAAGRSNVIGILEGRQQGRSLMLCGHMDTVGVAGMDAPFDPVQKDGRIYGPGSQGMKGGLASMIAAIMRMARVLARLEKLDHEIQSRKPHPIHGTGSLHASLINGGRELSTYPDWCTLQMERRTIAGEPNRCAFLEVEKILDDLKSEDPEFKASAKFLFSRPPYLTPEDHDLSQMIGAIVAGRGMKPVRGGMTFWTDAAILGEAGIPSIVFGPRGAGLHSTLEYVFEEDVLACRDILIELATGFC